MKRRARGVNAHRGPVSTSAVVMVCDNPSELECIQNVIAGFDSCELICYSAVEDLVLNAPSAGVSLVIFAGDAPDELLRRSLRWLKRWRPSAASAVIGQPGQVNQEITARSCGADYYFVRPVTFNQWQALLEHAIVSKPASFSGGKNLA